MTIEATPTWSVIYPDAAVPEVVMEPSVPGESTLADEGAIAFERDTIRRHIRMLHGNLDLREWLSVVPQVHGTFATSGAQKTVSLLQATTLEPGSALLDAFAHEMATWAKSNDPALELSATALP
jgi:hypothetical protein